MHIISPTGTVLHYPMARHAAPIEGGKRLYADSTKTEWVADVPADWVIAPSAPEHTTQDQLQALELERALHFRGEHPTRRRIYLFGFHVLTIE